jgi:enoyl-CoA hydratase/carnithine racemase
VEADPRASALATAHEIASHSPHAIRAAKRLLNRATACDVEEQLTAETTEQAALLGSANQVEAVRANLEKRAPNWSNP